MSDGTASNDVIPVFKNVGTCHTGVINAADRNDDNNDLHEFSIL